MTEKRAPWIKWYPADWRADPRLRMCSLAARGLWIEMLGYMHEGAPYGHFVVNGRPPQPRDIAALVGAPVRAVEKALAELRENGVFSTTEGGLVYSRRMLRDKAKQEADRANGGRGGNPKLRTADNPDDNPGVNPPDKAQMPDARDQMSETRDQGCASGIVSLPNPEFKSLDSGKNTIPERATPGSPLDDERAAERQGAWFQRAAVEVRLLMADAEADALIASALEGDPKAKAQVERIWANRARAGRRTFGSVEMSRSVEAALTAERNAG